MPIHIVSQKSPKLQTTVRGFLCVPSIRCTWTTVRFAVNGHVWAHCGSNRLGDRRTGQPMVDAMPSRSLCPGGCRPGIIDHYLSLLGWSAIARCRGGIFFQQGGDLRPGLFAVAVNQIFDSAIGQHPDRLLPVGNPILSRQCRERFRPSNSLPYRPPLFPSSSLTRDSSPKKAAR